MPLLGAQVGERWDTWKVHFGSTEHAIEQGDHQGHQADNRGVWVSGKSYDGHGCTRTDGYISEQHGMPRLHSNAIDVDGGT